jgi:hypothetical protein
VWIRTIGQPHKTQIPSEIEEKSLNTIYMHFVRSVSELLRSAPNTVGSVIDVLMDLTTTASGLAGVSVDAISSGFFGSLLHYSFIW